MGASRIHTIHCVYASDFRLAEPFSPFSPFFNGAETAGKWSDP